MRERLTFYPKDKFFVNYWKILAYMVDMRYIEYNILL